MTLGKVPIHSMDNENDYADRIFHSVEGKLGLFIIGDEVYISDPDGPIPAGFVRGHTAYGYGEMPLRFHNAKYARKTGKWLTFLEKVTAERGESIEFWAGNFIYPILGTAIPDPEISELADQAV